MQELDNTYSAGAAVSRLRAATRSAHEHVEALVDMMGPRTSRQRYGSLLNCSAACAVPLEARVVDLAPRDAPSWLSQPRRGHWLAHDMAVLGIRRTPIRVRLPHLDRWPEALGCAYVLEGSTLGGQILSRYLFEHVSLPPDAFHYLASYGDEVGARWQTFRAYLDEFMRPSTPLERRVIDGALATFEAFADAYSVLDASEPARLARGA